MLCGRYILKCGWPAAHCGRDEKSRNMKKINNVMTEENYPETIDAYTYATYHLTVVTLELLTFRKCHVKNLLILLMHLSS